MSVLVIGGAGYVGSHTVLAMKDAGMRVVVLDDLSTGHRKLVPAGVPLYEAPLEDGAALRTLLRTEGITAVLHFAARSLVEESVRNPRKYFEANAGGALTLTGAMLDCGVQRIVFSSTAAIFGEPAQQLPGRPAGAAIEDDAKRVPLNPYGESKAFIEDLLLAYRVHGLRSVALRYFNAAGADAAGRSGEDHEPETHLIPIVLDVALGRRAEVTVFGTDYPTRDGSCLRDYVHVTDLAAAHLAALRHLDAGGDSLRLNLGSGQGTTVREVISTVAKVTGRPVPVREGARRPGDPAALVASSAGAERVLGWRPTRGIDTIVQDAWNWHQKLRA